MQPELILLTPNEPPSNKNAGAWINTGKVVSAGDGSTPGPTGRVVATNPNSPSAAAVSGQGEYPIVTTAKYTAAASTVNGFGGSATAVAAPNSVWVGQSGRATAAADATGLYGGSLALAPQWVSGTAMKRAPSAEVQPRRYARLANGDVNFGPGGGKLGGFGSTVGNDALWGGGPNTASSYGGAQVFDVATLGVSGSGGPIAVAEAREAVAASVAGSEKLVDRPTSTPTATIASSA